MREFVLNDASLVATMSASEALKQLIDVARASAILVKRKVATPVLRIASPLMDLQCAIDRTLWQCVLDLLKRPETRDEARFLSVMATKCPIYVDLDAAPAARYWGVQKVEGHLLSTSSLIVCALSDAIAISFPQNTIWDTDRLNVPFEELSDTGVVESTEQLVDNIARPTHGQLVAERSRQDIIQALCDRHFEGELNAVFPDISFAPEVEIHFRQLNPQFIPLVAKRIDELNEASREWRLRGGPAPLWRSKVSPESAKVCQSPDLRSARVFRGLDGRDHFYEWHARFGSGGRIHFRFEPDSRLVEIGYIGEHLPLA